eukprot:TRINITY_DN24870_c0_g1_i2.p1 TRINITY_DN24870_c0_g1~~TRINITY_DN24870_c0_g1_i2.p1  ORF type:complete len:2588 (+),score=813.76 TRINITY_DN24870_c0_g1_i2:684-7766(+)
MVRRLQAHHTAERTRLHQVIERKDGELSRAHGELVRLRASANRSGQDPAPGGNIPGSAGPTSMGASALRNAVAELPNLDAEHQAALARRDQEIQAAQVEIARLRLRAEREEEEARIGDEKVARLLQELNSQGEELELTIFTKKKELAVIKEKHQEEIDKLKRNVEKITKEREVELAEMKEEMRKKLLVHESTSASQENQLETALKKIEDSKASEVSKLQMEVRALTEAKDREVNIMKEQKDLEFNRMLEQKELELARLRDEMRNALDLKEGELSQVRSELARLRDQMLDELARLRDEQEAEVERRIGTKERDLQALQEELTSLQDELKLSNNELHTLELQLKRKDEEHHDADIELGNAKAELYMKEDELRRSYDETDAMRKLADEAHANTMRVEKEIGELNMKIASRDNEINTLEGEVEDMRVAQQSKEEEMQHFSKELALLLVELRATKTTELAGGAIADADPSGGGQAQAGVMQLLVKLRSAFARMEDEVRVAQVDTQRLQAETKMLTADLDRNRMKLEATDRDLTQTRKELTKATLDKEKVQAWLDRRESEVKEKDQEIAKTQRILKKKKEEVADLTDQLQDAQDAVQDMTALALGGDGAGAPIASTSASFLGSGLAGAPQLAVPALVEAAAAGPKVCRVTVLGASGLGVHDMPEGKTMTIRIQIVSATGLQAGSGNDAGKPDPMIIGMLKGRPSTKFTTPKEDATSEPEFNYETTLENVTVADQLELRVVDEAARGSSQDIGKVLVMAKDAYYGNLDDELILQADNAKPGRARLHVVLTVTQGGSSSSEDLGSPFVICEVDNKVNFKTKPKEKNAHPRWDETHQVLEYYQGADLSFRVMDNDSPGQAFLIGKASLSSEMFEKPGGFEGEIKLQGAQGFRGGYKGSLRLRAEVMRGSVFAGGGGAGPRRSSVGGASRRGSAAISDAEASRLRAETAQQQRALMTAQHEVATLSAEVGRKHGELVTTSAELQRVRNDNARTQELLQQAQAEITQFSVDAGGKEAAVRNLEMEARRKEAELKKLRQANEQMSMEFQTMKSDFDKSNSDLRTLSVQTAQLQSTLVQRDAQLRSTISAQEALLARVAKAEDELKISNQELMKLRAEADPKEEMVLKTYKELEGVRQELRAKNQEFVDLLTQSVRTGKDMDKLKEDLQREAQERNTLAKKLSDDSEIIYLTRDRDSKMHELRALQKEMERVELELRKAHSELGPLREEHVKCKEELEQSKSKLMDLQHESERAGLAMARLARSVEPLMKEESVSVGLEAVRDSMEKKEIALFQLKNEFDTANRDLDHLRVENQALKKELNQLRESNTEREKMMDRERLEGDVLREQLRKANVDVVPVQKEVTEARIQLEKQRKELLVLRTSSERAAVALARMAQSSDALSVEDLPLGLELVKAEMDKQEIKLVQLQTKLREGELELEKLRPQVKMREDEATWHRSQAALKNNELQSETDELARVREELKKANTELPPLRVEAESLREELVSCRSDVQRIRLQQESANTAMSMFVQTLDHSVGEVKDVSAGLSIIREFIDRLTGSTANHKQIERQKEDEIAAVRAELATATDELKRIKYTLELKGSEFQSADAEIAQLRVEADRKEYALRSLETEVAGLREELRRRRDANTSAVSSHNEIRALLEDKQTEFKIQSSELERVRQAALRQERELKSSREAVFELQGSKDNLLVEVRSARLEMDRLSDELRRKDNRVVEQESDISRLTVQLEDANSNLKIAMHDLEGREDVTGKAEMNEKELKVALAEKAMLQAERQRQDMELKRVQHKLETVERNLQRTTADKERLSVELEKVQKAKQQATTKAAKEETAAPGAVLKAAREGIVSQVRTLVQRGADVNETDQEGATPLHIACAHGNLEVVRYLLAAGAGVELRDKNSLTPLLAASYQGHADVVELLCRSGVNVNAPDVEGWTALYASAFTGNTAVARSLLAANADPALAAKDGSTPLVVSKVKAHPAIEKLLLAALGETSAAAAKSHHHALPGATPGTSPARRGRNVDLSKVKKETRDYLKSHVKAASYDMHGMNFDKMFAHLNHNNTGHLSEEEWIHAARHTFKVPAKELSDKELKSVFAALDADGSGTMELTELLWLCGLEGGQGHPLAKPPKALWIHAPATVGDSPVTGKYNLVETRLVGGLALFKQATGANYLFSGTNGHWIVGDESEASVDFQTDTGVMATVYPHQGFMPTVMNRRDWQYFDGDIWIQDKTIAVSAKDPESERLPKELEAKLRAKLNEAAKTFGAEGKHDIGAIFIRLDKNGDGAITKEEFVTGFRIDLKIDKNQLSDKELGQLFVSLDTDNSGKVELQELVHFAEPATAKLAAYGGGDAAGDTPRGSSRKGGLFGKFRG